MCTLRSVAVKPPKRRGRGSGPRARGPAPIASSGLEHDPEKWTPVFRKRSCSNKKIERDDDSKKSHLALVVIAIVVIAIVAIPIAAVREYRIRILGRIVLDAVHAHPVYGVSGIARTFVRG